jgi:hypothetical protein
LLDIGCPVQLAFHLINRFSEDIDIGEPATVEQLEHLSGKKRQARFDAIKASCQAHHGALSRDFSAVIAQTMQAAGM